MLRWIFDVFELFGRQINCFGNFRYAMKLRNSTDLIAMKIMAPFSSSNSSQISILFSNKQKCLQQKNYLYECEFIHFWAQKAKTISTKLVLNTKFSCKYLKIAVNLNCKLSIGFFLSDILCDPICSLFEVWLKRFPIDRVP